MRLAPSVLLAVERVDDVKEAAVMPNEAKMSRAALDLEQTVREAVAHFIEITPPGLLSDDLSRQTLTMVFLTGMEAAAEIANNERLRAAIIAVEREIRTD